MACNFLISVFFRAAVPDNGLKKQRIGIRLKLIARVGLVTYEFEIYKTTVFSIFAAVPDK